MKTLGIDLSSQKNNTACATINWTADTAVAEPPETRCDDARLDLLVAAADATGIDAPLGWPLPFKDAVANWPFSEWTTDLRDALRFRETDRVARQRLGKAPLSVSTDLIALPAMRAMALLTRCGVTDKSGGERGIYEVYPAGSLRLWQAYRTGYKKSQTERIKILATLRSKLPYLQIPDEYANTDHSLDALVASLSARAAAQGLSILPSRQQIPIARNEGWIHLPSAPPSLENSSNPA